MQHPARAFQVYPDLVYAVLHRHIHGLQRGLANDAIRFQTVTLLEFFYAAFNVGIEQRRSGISCAHVARRCQPLPYGTDTGIGHTRLQYRTRGDRLPAAALLDVAVARERSPEF